MRPSPLPSLEYLKSRLIYCSETGDLTWKQKINDGSFSEAEMRRWNNRFSGKTIVSRCKAGYVVFALGEKQYKAHRVCYALGHNLETMAMENAYIDHISGKIDDNRLENLRLVSASQNSKNTKKSTRNKSGVVGVCGRKMNFEVYASTPSGRKYLGRFNTIEDAIRARKIAEIEYDYHQNHGRSD